MQVKASLAKQDLSVADRAKIEAAIAQKVPRDTSKGFGEKVARLSPAAMQRL